MYSGNLISLKTILWRVFNRPTTEGLNYEDAAEYAIEGLKLIGAPLVYIDKTTHPPIEIVNYKAALPSCIINIRGVKLLGNDGDVAMRRATDLYHSNFPCDGEGVNTEEECDNKYTEFTYTAQGGVIQTSVNEGQIVISYKSLAVDDEGYPLIPDNQKVKLALEYYILYRFLEPLWEMGKITDKVFQRVEQQKDWYIGSSNTSMQLQSGDHLESVMNSINRLIVNDKAFDNFYKGSGKKEIIKKYY